MSHRVPIIILLHYILFDRGIVSMIRAVVYRNARAATLDYNNILVVSDVFRMRYESLVVKFITSRKIYYAGKETV